MKSKRSSGTLSHWKEELRRQATELEDWIDRVALRLGDAILGEEISDKLFGPHPRGH